MATVDNTTFTYFFQNFIAYPTFDNYTDVVFNVNWKYTAVYIDPTTQKEYKVDTMRMTQVDTNNITNFVPFDQLTQQDCIGWVSSVENIPDIQQSLVNSINNQINPPPPTIVVLPPPFAQ
jgi:hypothetical protein